MYWTEVRIYLSPVSSDKGQRQGKVSFCEGCYEVFSLYDCLSRCALIYPEYFMCLTLKSRYTRTTKSHAFLSSKMNNMKL